MLGKSNTVAGVVRDPDGRPVSEARVYFTAGPVPFHDVAALTNDLGEFSLPAPVDGNYEIECATEGFPIAFAKVVVKSGRATTLQIKLKPD